MPERDYCRWCANEAHDPRTCTCPHDCGVTGCQVIAPHEVARA